MSVFVGGISKCDPQLPNAEPAIVPGNPGLQACAGNTASPQACVPASLGLASMHEPRPDITQGSKLSAPQFQSALCPCGRSPWPCLVWPYDAAPRPGF